MLTRRQRAFRAFQRSGGVALEAPVGWELSPAGHRVRVTNRAAAARQSPPKPRSEPPRRGRQARLAAINDATDQIRAKHFDDPGIAEDQKTPLDRLIDVHQKTLAKLHATISELLNIGDVADKQADELAQTRATIENLEKRLVWLEEQ